MVHCTHNTTTSISWDIILNFILTLQKPCPKSWSTNDINGYRSFSNILSSRIFTAYLFPGPSFGKSRTTKYQNQMFLQNQAFQNVQNPELVLRWTTGTPPHIWCLRKPVVIPVQMFPSEIFPSITRRQKQQAQAIGFPSFFSLENINFFSSIIW